MTLDEFFTAICSALGWTATPWRLAVFNFWAAREGMPESTNNPLATTQFGDLDLTYDHGYGPGNWNWVPVRVYRTPAAGIQATVETLTNGYYPNILRCFADQTGYQEAVGPRDFTSWVGSASYGQSVVDFMNSCTESKENDMAWTEEQEARVRRIEKVVADWAGDGEIEKADGLNIALWLGLKNQSAALDNLIAAVKAGATSLPDNDKAAVADALEAAATALRQRQ